MKNKKKWKQLAALALSAVMLFPAQGVYAENQNNATTEIAREAVSETTEADFIIKNTRFTLFMRRSGCRRVFCHIVNFVA